MCCSLKPNSHQLSRKFEPLQHRPSHNAASSALVSKESHTLLARVSCDAHCYSNAAFYEPARRCRLFCTLLGLKLGHPTAQIHYNVFKPTQHGCCIHNFAPKWVHLQLKPPPVIVPRDGRLHTHRQQQTPAAPNSGNPYARQAYGCCGW